MKKINKKIYKTLEFQHYMKNLIVINVAFIILMITYISILIVSKDDFFYKYFIIYIICNALIYIIPTICYLIKIINLLKVSNQFEYYKIFDFKIVKNEELSKGKILQFRIEDVDYVFKKNFIQNNELLFEKYIVVGKYGDRIVVVNPNSL